MKKQKINESWTFWKEVKSRKTGGDIKITASAPGMESVSVSVKTE